jgi:tetratricopeptide (TPR) repeat protein
MRQRSLECLLGDVAFALKQGMGPGELVPMLERLLEIAPVGSEARRFGRLQLAELMIHDQPFRAASLARPVALECVSDRAWGIVGLAMTVLGHYRAAVRAYRRALLVAPSHVEYLHNLGHVLDVGLDRFHEACPYLEQAHRGEPKVKEIASSLAHAVARSGHLSRAVELLSGCVGMTETMAFATIEIWLSRAPEASTGQAR